MKKTMQLFKTEIILTGLLFSSASNALYLYGDDVATLQGYDAHINTYDTSTLTMVEFSASAHVNAYDQSTINVQTQGSISHFTTHDQSTANIYGGDYSFVNILDNSVANVYDFGRTSWFSLGLDAQLNIFGEDLMYHDGHVSGLSSSGYRYHFRVQNVDEFGMLLDGAPSNVTLNQVPLPASLYLFLSGLVGLYVKTRSKRI